VKPSEAVAQQAAGEERAELATDERGQSAALVGTRKEGFEVLLQGAIQQSLLGLAPAIRLALAMIE
jgi:hypothetical protein